MEINKNALSLYAERLILSTDGADSSNNLTVLVMENKVYQMVTDRIIEEMSKGIIPWHKPWHLSGSEEELAINYVTRRPYSLVNQWLLMEPGEYLTFKQATALGGKVKKGAKSHFVVFYTKVNYTRKNEETGEDEIKSYPFLKYYNVFRLSDVEGIDSKIVKSEIDVTEEIPLCDEADMAICDYVESQPTLSFQNDKPSDRAYYSPADDKVVVPMPCQYTDSAEYYSTTFHELVHSTLPENRCNRRKQGEVAFFGSHAYSREELVAEIGAAMLVANFGIDSKAAFKNSVAYLQSWASNLKKDPKAIVVASAKAEKAVRFILGERETAQV